MIVFQQLNSLIVVFWHLFHVNCQCHTYIQACKIISSSTLFHCTVIKSQICPQETKQTKFSFSLYMPCNKFFCLDKLWRKLKLEITNVTNQNVSKAAIKSAVMYIIIEKTFYLLSIAFERFYFPSQCKFYS